MRRVLTFTRQGKTLTPEAEFLASVCLASGTCRHCAFEFALIVKRAGLKVVSSDAHGITTSANYDRSGLVVKVARKAGDLLIMNGWASIALSMVLTKALATLCICHSMRNDCNNFWMILKVELQLVSGMYELAVTVQFSIR